jgi:hypothetical protein
MTTASTQKTDSLAIRLGLLIAEGKIDWRGAYETMRYFVRTDYNPPTIFILPDLARSVLEICIHDVECWQRPYGYTSEFQTRCQILGSLITKAEQREIVSLLRSKKITDLTP